MWNRVLCCLLAVAIGLAMASPILASAPAAGDDGGMNPFAPSAWKTDLALWTAVVFLCLLAILAKFAIARRSAIVGKIGSSSEMPLVEMATSFGGRRVVQMPYGEDLPRIC